MKSVAAAVTLAVSCGSGYAAPGDPPANWTLVAAASQSNVKVYKKGSSQIYAQVVDMVGGAKVDMLQIYTSTVGGFKRYKRDSINNWYTYNGNSSRVSVVNGDYFNPNLTPNTTLSFAIRSGGSLLEVGGDRLNDLQIEFFTGQGAMVLAANHNRMLGGTTAQNAIGGYSPPLSPRFSESVGRTGFCTLSPSSPSRLFLVLSHYKVTQTTANNDFSAWNCNSGSIIMMDGSASAQLRANGITMLGNDGGSGNGRPVPQAIAIRNQ